MFLLLVPIVPAAIAAGVTMYGAASAVCAATDSLSAMANKHVTAKRATAAAERAMEDGPVTFVQEPRLLWDTIPSLGKVLVTPSEKRAMESLSILEWESGKGEAVLRGIRLTQLARRALLA